jgi:hypothetical protein
MERLTREMTFEEEYTFLKKEVKELFDKEDRKSEPPESHCVVRRALRCIKKLVAELEPYKEYKDLEEQGLLLRLPCKIGATVYYIEDNEINKFVVYSFDIRPLQQFVCNYEGIRLNFKNFGKTVFLTQAEAGQKLKEMESE